MVIRRYANREISARNGGDNPVPSSEKPYKALYEGQTTIPNGSTLKVKFLLWKCEVALVVNDIVYPTMKIVETVKLQICIRSITTYINYNIQVTWWFLPHVPQLVIEEYMKN